MLTKEELQEIVRIVFFNKEVGEERLTDFTEALVSSAVKLVDCIGNHHSRCRIYLLAMKGAQSSDTRQMYLELARATALMVTGPEDDRFSMHHRIVLARAIARASGDPLDQERFFDLTAKGEVLGLRDYDRY